MRPLRFTLNRIADEFTSLIMRWTGVAESSG
jgi:hypothetical protein